MDSVFLLGAGAEVGFHLPNGNDYAKKTIFYNNHSNDEELKMLFDRLKNYYNNKDYGHYFINSNNSIDIANQRKLLYFHLKNIKGDPKARFYSEKNKILLSFLNDADFKEFDLPPDFLSKVKEYDKYGEIKEAFDEKRLIGFENDFTKPYDIRIDEDKCTNINFFELERLYHTVINPKKYGTRKYCQLINYYWCCFHLIYSKCAKILLDYDTIDQLYGNGKGIDFDVIKSNLEKMLIVIRHRRLKPEIYQYSYYYALSQLFPEAAVVTTNYSPYAYICHDPIFIHGNILTFESGPVPELITYKKLNSELKNLFPYLLCQSALKPIIHPLQIKNFNNMINALMNANKLFVIGYGLNDDDNHINAIIKDFLKSSKNNKLIYIAYGCDNMEIIRQKEYFCELFQVENSQIIIHNIEKVKNNNKTENEYEQFYNILKDYSVNKKKILLNI